jgi:hypothetical protein
MIDMLHAEQRRQPFDFNITSRPALISALATDGASLTHTAERATTFTTLKDRREGIEICGMHFWHDYPLQQDKLSLHPAWQDKIAEVNAKYIHLWKRFSSLIRSDEPKTFVLSNAQRNLTEFAADAADFDRKFGLGRQAFDEIAGAMDAYGACNFSIKFLSRTIEEVRQTADLQEDRLKHRFAGELGLRPDPTVAARLLLTAETSLET